MAEKKTEITKQTNATINILLFLLGVIGIILSGTVLYWIVTHWRLFYHGVDHWMHALFR